MRCWYSCTFPVSGQMTALALPGCNSRFMVTWLMTTQSSPAGRTRGSGLLGLEGGVLIATRWFAMRSCPCIRLDLVLYWCCVGILWVFAAFLCAAGGIGLVSPGTMCGTRWVGCLGVHPSWNVMYLCGYTLGSGAGTVSGAVYGVFIIVGGATCVESALVNIYAILRSAAVCFPPNI